ncbi:fimbrial protein [Acinetobacter sp. YH12201]|uniref:fimbrial protein n=1 Tax=Acinetobacter sp. YH12201 TaxID=2601140 RepID=UPI0015D2765B|nr:fimbrial protein [Acinetobacter sp. YH12201]
MDDKFYIVLKLFFVMLLMSIGINVQAQCYFVNYMNGQPTDRNSDNSDKVTETNDRSAAKIPIGNLHLNPLQKAGDKIAEIIVSPMEYKVRNATADTILWRCAPDTNNMSDVRFLVATNGNALHGGQVVVPTENPGDQTNVYYTGFNGIGIRQTMAGVTVTGTWKTVPVSYDIGTYTGTVSNATQCPSGWYCIRLKHIPNLTVEFFKVDGSPGVSSVCGSVENSGNYSCEEPSAYIQLADSSLIGGPVTFGHDKELDNSGSHMLFLGANNGFGYTLYNAANLIPAANTCWAITANTQTVTFPTTSTTHLDTDGEVFADFQIQIACTGNVTAGLNTTNFAVGIQASQASYTQAQALGLVNANQGVTALVSDDYASNAARAKHVGIFLYKDGGSTPMNFVGQPGSTGSNFPQTETKSGLSNCSWSNPDISDTGTGTCYLPITFPMGNDAGWYAFSELTQSFGDKTTNIPLRAVLKKLPSAGAVTAGSVLATAHVLVKMQ